MTGEPIEDPLVGLLQLAAEMHLKYRHLQVGDLWTDYVSREEEPEGWLAYNRLNIQLASEFSGVRPIAPS